MNAKKNKKIKCEHTMGGSLSGVWRCSKCNEPLFESEKPILKRLEKDEFEKSVEQKVITNILKEYPKTKIE